MHGGGLAVDASGEVFGDVESHEDETADGEGGFVLVLETDTLERLGGMADIVGWEDQQGPSVLSELY